MRSLVRLVGSLCLLAAPWPAPAQVPEGPAGVERRVLDHATRLEEAGRREEGMRALENLLDDQPLSVSALVMLSQMAERAGQPGRVLPRAEIALVAGEPGARALRQLWIRALQAAGLQDSAVSAARRWIAEAPDDQLGYAELSGIRARSGDLEAAAAVLEEARSAIGSDRVFVQELAVLRSESGAYTEAAVEWRSMLTWGAPGVEAVDRHLTAAGEDRERAVAALRGEMARPESTYLELKGALDLAFLTDEQEWARSLAARMVAELPEAGGTEILRDFVARARREGDIRGAAWAAGELTIRSRSEEERLYWTAVAADLARDAGDRRAALEAFEDLYERARPGSDLYGLALRRLHSLELDARPARADRLLQEHVELYPGDREASIEMSVASARAWADRGDLDRARWAIGRLEPSGAEEAALQAATLGWIELVAGDPVVARGHLEMASAVPGYDPAARLSALELLSTIAASDPEALAALGAALRRAYAEVDFGPLMSLTRTWAREGTMGGDRMTDLAAREAYRAGDVEAATALRLDLLEDWPSSVVAPRVMLDLARASAGTDAEAASAWLERLIVEYPRSAVAPTARRMLADLRRGVPGA